MKNRQKTVLIFVLINKKLKLKDRRIAEYNDTQILRTTLKSNKSSEIKC